MVKRFKKSNLLKARNLINFYSKKVILGAILIVFFSGYQPNLSIPPIKQAVARAQVEQVTKVNSESLPFKFQLPHPGYLSTAFSNYHPGIDIASGLGMPVKPVAEGVITEAGFSFWGLGLNVSVKHPNGYKSVYAHLGKIYVKKGQNVTDSTTLGVVGLTGHTTGPHTHLEVTKDGNYIDPQLVLPAIRKNSIAEDFSPVVIKEDTNKVDVKKQIQTSL